MISCSHGSGNRQSREAADSIVTDSIAISDNPKNYLNIQTKNFTEIDSSGILMLPLTMGESPDESGGLYYKSIPVSSCWNMIFLNLRTNEYHLLSDKKIVIRDYEFYNSGDYNTSYRTTINKSDKFLFYTVTSDDYNKDKKLTSEDPTYLFVSDKEGRNFKQISPSNYDIQKWKFIPSVNKIIIAARKDTNRNTRFEENEEVTTFEVDFNRGMEPQEVFTADFKRQLRELYDRDWKRIKD
ncbi:hypothetical protein FPE01S_01_17280 [Flavihumibacter petaseus NBRC 106054]|uniref:Uncharacterized protein n=1 Tax=Flavihumibacter petaseus NBRC 106054 TaxID=1220578 RepID=A0A0E9MYA2_9BACT|nr:hypothetical protein FPE01S_01_17280 [Flavihumibacter petaseus NBRC 106054]